MVTNPLVSVIIPTFDRPFLVKRAVLSALGQTFKALEVIVVIDRPDGEATRSALSDLTDSRIRVIEHSKNMGTNSARNSGIASARGKWLALLDDDDEWFPRKIEAQLRTAETSLHEYPIVACQLIHRTDEVDLIQPRRLPYPREHMSDYLFSRRGLARQEGILVTSVFFAHRELFLRVPFDEKIWGITDTDWLLRAIRLKGVGLEIVQETLTTWNADDGRPRASKHFEDWRSIYDWVLEKRDLFTPRAYASFIMGFLSGSASRTRKPSIFRLLYKEAVRNGCPALIDYLIFFYIWLIPQTLRAGLRRLLILKPSTLKLLGDQYGIIK